MKWEPKGQARQQLANSPEASVTGITAGGEFPANGSQDHSALEFNSCYNGLVIAMRVVRCLCSFMLIAVLTVLLGANIPAQTATQSFSDSFHSTTLDRSHWIIGKINAQGEAIPTQEGLRLTLSVRNVAPFFALNLWLNCRIPGDFDAQVNYRLVDWPYASGIRLGLGVHPNPLPLGSTSLHGLSGNDSGLRTVISERISLRAGEVTTHSTGGEFYTAELNGRQNRLTTTSDRSGKLRVTRVQNDFTAWYWDIGSHIWIPTGRFSLNPQVGDSEWLALQLWGYSQSPNITVVVENFSVSAQTLSCP